MRTRGRDGSVAGRVTDMAEAQVRRDDAEASQLQAGRYLLTGPH